VIVEERYTLPRETREKLENRLVQWGFGPLSSAVYYRTYSRLKEDETQETWVDTIVRVVEGVMSIRKDWYVNALGKRWDKRRWDAVAEELAFAMFEMRLLPPGRGLWAMGTDYVYERGSHALNNCGLVEVNGSLAVAARWMMDSLMCGVGVGFTTYTADLRVKHTRGAPSLYVIPDTKEGWAESVKRLVQSYERGSKPMEFDYSEIRRAGTPIRGFGGVSAGSKPLRDLHVRLRRYMDAFADKKVDQTRVIADVMNAIGACVVAGNVRRSAEIAVGAPSDETFMNLKNYEMYPERQDIGWMSNNSVALSERDHFSALPDVAERVADNGEPGILNLMNVQKYGRIGEKSPDAAIGTNPCGEIPLESGELCNLVEVFPTRCSDDAELQRTLELATFYASTVALLPSHSEITNEVVSRNRRIGVSVSGIADWLDATSVSHVFDALNRGYDVVRAENRKLAKEAGVAESIRVTTIKPSGTVSLLAGVSSGTHFPIGGHVLRRVRVGAGSPVSQLLAEAGVPHEPDVVSEATEVFEFPLRYGRGRTRSVKNVSVFEQAAVVAMLSRAWADNAVSNTLTVQPNELHQVERVLSLFAPLVKSMSLLPDRTGVYSQMPVEHITKDEFETRAAAINEVDWDRLSGSDGDASSEAYCTTDACEVPQR
jgi:ribonucleoside-diphosphate reductase alpha chain